MVDAHDCRSLSTWLPPMLSVMDSHICSLWWLVFWSCISAPLRREASLFLSTLVQETVRREPPRALRIVKVAL